MELLHKMWIEKVGCLPVFDAEPKRMGCSPSIVDECITHTLMDS
jgi:hypothetical protein